MVRHLFPFCIAVALGLRLTAVPIPAATRTQTAAQTTTSVQASTSAVQAPTSASPSPRLIVLIVVDQMRADYVERFGADWTGGLKRLLSEGAWFSNAAYPYLTTVTCPGHATVSTGAFPHTHGIFQNAWYDRSRRRIVTCTEDPDVDAVEYDGDVDDGSDSSTRLRVPTFADELRQKGGRVATIALKPRSAIMLAGKGGDAVTWLNTDLDGWETSTAYSTRMVPEVKAFLDANPIDADLGKVWTRLLPLARYQGPDAADGESPPRGWTPLFPHPLSGESGKADASFHTRWERSPFANAYVARFAAAVAESLRLGRGTTTDFLGVSFSTPDLVGHAFGPRSQEVQDIYAHLDRDIGALLTRLDALVGAGRYVVALSSDHGVTPIPEQLRKDGLDAGRLNATTLAGVIERAAQAGGPGRYVARVYGNDVYFEPGMYDRLSRIPAAIDAMIDNIQRQPGVARLLSRAQVIDGPASTDAAVRAAALSYVPGTSGDMILVPKPGWMFTAAGSTHGTMNPEDQQVPVILMGPGVKPGRYRDPATPADVAPTLAALAGIAMPRAEGHPLSAALAGAVTSR